MNPDKNAIVAQLAERLQGCPYVLLVDYTGMTVPQFNEMRKRLKGTSANFHVTKNSYIKAVGKFPKELEKDLAGQTAVVYGDNDVCAAAKVVKSFAAEFQRPTLKSGVLDGTLLSAAEVGALADVGSRNNMLAKLLGTINAPASALARVIQAKFSPDGAESADSAETPVAADAPAAEAPATE